jgi:hypothetical protein
VQVGQVPVALLEVEAVPHEELVGHREAHVADGQVVHEPAIGAVEERHRGEGAGVAERECLAEVVERQARVDDVLDDQDVATRDLRVQVLEQADPGMAALVGAGRIARELDEVEAVVDPERAGQVGDEDDARLERRDEQRLFVLVVTGDLAPELADTRPQLPAREVDLPEPRLGGYVASSSWYRSARRSMSRL